jgi:hypothetical protein
MNLQPTATADIEATDALCMLDAALDLRDFGFPVFPLWPMRKGRCACGKDCGRNAGKHPLWIEGLIEHGLSDATVDDATIRSWWAACPDAGIGYLPELGLDVDPRAGGHLELERLEMNHGPLPETVEVLTGRGDGGRHILYVLPEPMELPSTLAPGIDIKGGGKGYLIAPPTLHASGNRYQWRPGFSLGEVDIVPAPGWLIEELRKAGAYYPKKGPASKPHPGDPAEVAKARQALDQLDKARADNYASWIRVGMILHSVSDDLGGDWDTWSMSSDKWVDGACSEKWATFDRDREKAAGLGTLITWAREDAPPPPADAAVASVDPNLLTVISCEDLLALKLPPREFVLEPILRVKDNGMIYGPRGLGKTWFLLGMASAIAAGGKFLNWTAPRPRSVLYIDGEMQAEALQDRLRIIKAACEHEHEGRLQFMSADLHEHGLPNLAEYEGQRRIDALLGGIEVLFLDNLSALCRGGVENEAASWESMQVWLLDLRRRRINTLFAHHAGNSGRQRGTSKREDTLDISIGLKKPEDYNPVEGLRFEVHFEKARHLTGNAAIGVEVRLQNLIGGMTWTYRTLDAAMQQRVVELDLDGLSQIEIAKVVGRSKSRISRILKAAKETK